YAVQDEGGEMAEETVHVYLDYERTRVHYLCYKAFQLEGLMEDAGLEFEQTRQAFLKLKTRFEEIGVAEKGHKIAQYLCLLQSDVTILKRPDFFDRFRQGYILAYAPRLLEGMKKHLIGNEIDSPLIPEMQWVMESLIELASKVSVLKGDWS